MTGPMTMTETLVIALGGNAITRPGESGAIPLQFAHTAETLEHLMPLFQTVDGSPSPTATDRRSATS